MSSMSEHSVFALLNSMPDEEVVRLFFKWLSHTDNAIYDMVIQQIDANYRDTYKGNSGTLELAVSEFTTRVSMLVGGFIQLDHGLEALVTIPSKELIPIVTKWLREVDKNALYDVLAAIVLEHGLVAHIETQTEEERLAALNMETDDLIHKIMLACVVVAEPGASVDSGLMVSIGDVYKHLESKHLSLPSFVVWSVLMTLSYIDGRVEDMGEGYYKLLNYHEKLSKEDKEQIIEALAFYSVHVSEHAGDTDKIQQKVRRWIE